MEPVTRTVRLEVFSDYTCPWCYVGWARLEKVLRLLPDGLEVSVEWRPFEIHPEVPAEGMPVTDLPYPLDVWERMQEALRQSAREEGLDVGNRPKVSNTHAALLAGSYAQAEEPGRFPAFHEGLFKGYFAEGGDLGDHSVLERLATVAGIDTVRMNAALAEGRYESTLTDATRDAQTMGIGGTPTFVFDRRFATSGAQPPEVLLRAFDAAVNSDQSDQEE